MATPSPGSRTPGRRSTRRTAAKVAVFLLLGAVVNVAVAWGLAAHVEQSKWSIPGVTGYTTPRADRYDMTLHVGLPFRSMSGHWTNRNGHITTAGFWSVPYPFGPLKNHYVFLPCRPVLPGFAINTLLYAAVLWLPFAAPGSVRKWRRVRRGLCPACAYPVGTSEVCTECGGHVARQPPL
jgi:hypothetical protein